MSAREIPRRDVHGARGRVAAPTRHIPANPEALTLRDIPQVLQPQQPQTMQPHFSVPAQQQFSQQAPIAPITPVATVAPTQPTSEADAAPFVSDDALARQRAALGFDDIPLLGPDELENEKTLREKASSWAKEAYTRGLSAESRNKVTRFIKDKEFLNWKDDLKWALKADKGEELSEQTVQPVPPQIQQQAPTPRLPLNVTADPTAQRQVRVPQRGPQFAAGLRAQTHLQQQLPVQPLTPAAATGNKSIDINISFGSLPKLPKLPNLKKYIPDPKPLLKDLRHLKWNRRTQVFSGVTIIFLLFVAPHFLPGGDAVKGNSTSGVSTVKTEAISQKPDYQTVVPSGKSADNVQWQRVSPPDHNPVFAYADKIDGIDINVSQQPVPDNFKPDVDSKVADLAKSYNATEKIIAGNTPIYVGTSGSGPQSAIFTKNNLLVLVKSTSKISESSWAKYAEALR
jgi:hypothetical protein